MPEQTRTMYSFECYMILETPTESGDTTAFFVTVAESFADAEAAANRHIPGGSLTRLEKNDPKPVIFG